MNRSQRIISEGEELWRSEAEEKIRKEVQDKYEPELEKASFLKRLHLLWKIRKEVSKRLSEVSSGYNLHSSFGSIPPSVEVKERIGDRKESS